MKAYKESALKSWAITLSDVQVPEWSEVSRSETLIHLPNVEAFGVELDGISQNHGSFLHLGTLLSNIYTIFGHLFGGSIMKNAGFHAQLLDCCSQEMGMKPDYNWLVKQSTILDMTLWWSPMSFIVSVCSMGFEWFRIRLFWGSTNWLTGPIFSCRTFRYLCVLSVQPSRSAHILSPLWWIRKWTDPPAWFCGLIRIIGKAHSTNFIAGLHLETVLFHYHETDNASGQATLAPLLHIKPGRSVLCTQNRDLRRPNGRSGCFLAHIASQTSLFFGFRDGKHGSKA